MASAIVSSKIKMLVPAGNARPTPPIGPILGQRGLKAIDFCKQFNEFTKKYEVDTPIPTILTMQPDPAKIDKGAAKPKHEIAGKVSLKHIYEIAKIKQNQDNMKDFDLRSICKSIVATCGSIGIEVVP
ncbi:ribosomal protein L11 [Rhizophagus irregularis]|uniref:Large ribosomal subunit protein uL11m n=1 Tax=Rhizophagus irregularis TaxID=588596 RepID=A0A2N0SJV4_9GLOM|nr:ribosomal protein L11 [Rhizophagus irregularis]